MKCEDKVAIVTGGGRGIGRAIALVLSKEGAKVVVWDVNEKDAVQVAAEVEKDGQPSKALKVNVSVGSEVRWGIEQVLNTWGRIDILVNNAGITGDIVPIEQIIEADLDRVMGVNFKGTFFCSQAVMGIMKRQRAGKIINMASVAGKMGGIAIGAHYSASKAAVICFTKTLARELAPFEVNVNGIAPGLIDTDMTRGEHWDKFQGQIPFGHRGTVDDVANVVLFLASEEANYLTGEIIDVNGGLLMD